MGVPRARVRVFCRARGVARDERARVAVEIFFRRGEMGATCTAPTGASAARAEPNPQRARRRDGRRDDEGPIRDEEKREI